MKEFILKHPIITWLIVGEICSMVKTCVAGHYTEPLIEESARKTIGEAIERKVNELDNQEPEEPEETVVTGFHPGN